MAEPVISAAPQDFTFQGISLRGVLVSFTGSQPRRGVFHQFLKRRGGRVEDMEGGQRQIEVVVQLLGGDGKAGSLQASNRTPAQQYEELCRILAKNPYGLLVHPTAGKWQAFCTGPNYDVSFARALNQIQVHLTFIENELDAPVSDTPVLGQAAQAVTSQQTQFQKVVAAFTGALAKAQNFVAETQAAIDNVLDQLDVLEAPLDAMQNVIAAGQGTTSRLIGQVAGVVSKANVLNESIESFIAQAVNSGPMFNGPANVVGGLGSTETLLGIVEENGQSLEDEMISVSPRPAAAADAVIGVHEAVAACIVMVDALKAAQPPIIAYTVPAKIDLLTLCQRRYKRDALAKANAILGMNRIPNPAVIPAGTVLLIPSR